MSEHIYKLTAMSRPLALDAVKCAPEGYVVRVDEPTRTLDQNSKLWPMLNDIAKQVIWYGARLQDHEWKDVFTAALVKAKVVPGLDGGFVVCGQRTSLMGKKMFSDLIELMYAFGSEKGVQWSERAKDFYAEYRRAA
jgi:hypothetical protein